MFTHSATPLRVHKSAVFHHSERIPSRVLFGISLANPSSLVSIYYMSHPLMLNHLRFHPHTCISYRVTHLVCFHMSMIFSAFVHFTLLTNFLSFMVYSSHPFFHLVF